MKKRQTHPGIQTAVLKLLNHEWNDNTNWSNELVEKDEQILKQAVQQQLNLGKFSLEKGFISKNRTEAQNSWSILNGHNKKHRTTWTHKVIIALQTYSLNLWYHRNTYIHGKNKKESRESQIQQCHERIDELYERDKKMFTIEQQAIFKLPKHKRKKQGLEAMSLWISTAELLMTIKTKGEQSTLDSLMFKQKQTTTRIQNEPII